MDINVSYFCDGEILKENLITVDMQGGTTAEVIVELLVNLMEEYTIPLENIDNSGFLYIDSFVRVVMNTAEISSYPS